MQRHIQRLTELLQVIGRRLVRDILHTHMDSLNTEAGLVYLSPFAQHLKQAQRVFSARQPHKDMITVLKKTVSDKSFYEAFANAFFK